VLGWISSDGTVHIIMDRCGTAENAERVFFEEVIGHKTINDFIGRERMQDFFKQVYEDCMNDKQREQWREHTKETTKNPDP